MSIDLTKFHATFFSESVDQLEQAETHLLELERDSSNSLSIQAIFRAVHSVKGSAGTLGFEAIANFSHEFENLLDQLRADNQAADQDTIGLCYGGLDLLLAMVCDARDKNGGIDASRIAGMCHRIQSSLKNTPQADTENLTEEKSVTQDSAKEAEWEIYFSPNSDFCASGNDPFLYLRELAQVGTARTVLNTSKLVELNQIDPTQAYLSWTIYLRTTKSESELRAVFEWVTDLCDFEVQASSGSRVGEPEAVEIHDENAPQLTKKESKPSLVDRRKPTIHVRADRLDFLINQIGEIAIAQSMFKRSLVIADQSQQVQADMSRLERQLRELQDTVLGLRMLPMRVLFGRFERTIRDAQAELNKVVKLNVQGEETEIDKTLIEKLADPLTHLVRNALDHGIEASEIRLQANKSAAGQLSLGARQEGNAIIITVADDGAGLKTEQIKRKAIAKKFALSTDEFSDTQWQQFIFTPGFSTASTVNKWSGRGVGLDVVRESMTALGGDVSVISEPGSGTQFVLRLPLTLAIIDALLVRSGGQSYAIGLNFIKEYIRPKSLVFVDIERARQVCMLRGQQINAMSLHQFMQQDMALDTQVQAHILIDVSGQQLVLGVDEVIGQEQIVVRSLDRHTQRPAWASGATILGDGGVALILDPVSMVHIANGKDTNTPIKPRQHLTMESAHV